jgi:hypothetical protein
MAATGLFACSPQSLTHWGATAAIPHAKLKTDWCMNDGNSARLIEERTVYAGEQGGCALCFGQPRAQPIDC